MFVNKYLRGTGEVEHGQISALRQCRNLAMLHLAGCFVITSALFLDMFSDEKESIGVRNKSLTIAKELELNLFATTAFLINSQR